MFPATDTSTSPRVNALPQTSGTPSARASGSPELSDAERRKLEELKATDARVRRHEEAHRAAAGSLYRGGPNYTYETGPDGKRYAVAGSVQIDTSPGKTPEETVQKASAIRRAALAPTDPSGTDRAVAAKASRMEAAARRALAKESIPSREAAPVPSPALPLKPADEASASTTREMAQDAPDPSQASEGSNGTLSPGDLGNEVWSVVSDLARSESLRQDERSSTPQGPSLDILA